MRPTSCGRASRWMPPPALDPSPGSGRASATTRSTGPTPRPASACSGRSPTSPARSYHVRPHYVFCSGSGFGIPHWGNGNVYHEDADGNPYYDFTIVDQTYDAIVGAGHHVLVELAFTPRDLVPPEADRADGRAEPDRVHLLRGRHLGLPAQGLRQVGRPDRGARPPLPRAVRRRRGHQLAVGTLERARHQLLARHPASSSTSSTPSPREPFAA